MALGSLTGRVATWLAAAALAGCVAASDGPATAPRDGGAADATALDVASADAGLADGAPPDALRRDAAPLDGDGLDDASPDAQAPDAAALDAEVMDAAAGDAEVMDAAAPDAQAMDGAAPDAEAPARCPDLPMDCAEVAPQGVEEHRLQPLDGCAFALRRTGDVAGAQALADALAVQGGGRLDLLDVLDDLNREARPGIGAAAADRLRNHDHWGVRWNAGDVATDAWYPQGVTGDDDAWADGHPRRLVLVSWYDHAEDGIEKGARISLLDLTDPQALRYRHLLLVTPRARGGVADFGPALYDGGGSLHAGGIVWWHPWLYVADTSQGLRVFDLSRVVRVPDVGDRDRIGTGGGQLHAHGYRYIVPQVARYQLAAEGCPVRFSFVGLDRSEAPPVLVTGEYRRDDALGRVVRWPLDPATGWLAADAAGQVRAVDAAAPGQSRLQGALTFTGDTYLSSSSQAGRLGRLYRTRAGLESRITAWPRGCEDLYLERSTDRIWTATEFPDDRDVVGIPRLPP